MNKDKYFYLKDSYLRTILDIWFKDKDYEECKGILIYLTLCINEEYCFKPTILWGSSPSEGFKILVNYRSDFVIYIFDQFNTDAVMKCIEYLEKYKIDREFMLESISMYITLREEILDDIEKAFPKKDTLPDIYEIPLLNKMAEIYSKDKYMEILNKFILVSNNLISMCFRYICEWRRLVKYLYGNKEAVAEVDKLVGEEFLFIQSFLAISNKVEEMEE